MIRGSYHNTAKCVLDAMDAGGRARAPKDTVGRETEYCTASDRGRAGERQVMLGLSSMALWVRIPLASPATARGADSAADAHGGARN